MRRACESSPGSFHRPGTRLALVGPNALAPGPHGACLGLVASGPGVRRTLRNASRSGLSTTRWAATPTHSTRHATTISAGPRPSSAGCAADDLARLQADRNALRPVAPCALDFRHIQLVSGWSRRHERLANGTLRVERRSNNVAGRRPTVCQDTCARGSPPSIQATMKVRSAFFTGHAWSHLVASVDETEAGNTRRRHLPDETQSASIWAPRGSARRTRAPSPQPSRTGSEYRTSWHPNPATHAA